MAQDRVKWRALVETEINLQAGYVKAVEFLDQLSDYLRIKGSAPWS
jgi:hypothetical protein